jgi:alcohol dehydrogenase class IV
MTDNLQKEVEFLGLAQSEAPEHAKKVSDFAKSVGSYRMLYENIYAEIQGLYDEAIKDPDNPDDPDEADNEAARKIAEDAINALEAVKRLQEEA